MNVAKRTLKSAWRGNTNEKWIVYRYKELVKLILVIKWGKNNE